ncbi:hypothetical protein KPH14_013101, partial [Odynerus spinipes]
DGTYANRITDELEDDNYTNRNNRLDVLHDEIEHLMSTLRDRYDEKRDRLKNRYVKDGIRNFRDIVNSPDDKILDDEIITRTKRLQDLLERYDKLRGKVDENGTGGVKRSNVYRYRRKRRDVDRGKGNRAKRDTAATNGGGAISNFSVPNFQENDSDRIATIFLSYFLKDDQHTPTTDSGHGVGTTSSRTERSRVSKRRKRATSN